MEFLVREFYLVFSETKGQNNLFLLFISLFCVFCVQKKSLNQIRRFAHNYGSARQIVGNRNAIFVEECIFIIPHNHL